MPAGSEFRYVQSVGCASIEYESEGAAAELLRTDMRHARAFQNAVMLLRALSEGRTVSAEPSVSAPAVRSAAGRFRAEAARSARTASTAKSCCAGSGRLQSRA